MECSGYSSELEEICKILSEEIDEAVKEAVDNYRAGLVLTIERGISFADLKELITLRIEL